MFQYFYGLNPMHVFSLSLEGFLAMFWQIHYCHHQAMLTFHCGFTTLNECYSLKSQHRPDKSESTEMSLIYINMHVYID